MSCATFFNIAGLGFSTGIMQRWRHFGYPKLLETLME
jgi:hypothetical protein